jgi:hypothetical protein
MSAIVKIAGLMALTATLTAGACASASVVAVNIKKEATCSDSAGGKMAYKWAWATAVTGGVVSGACIAGIMILIIK